MLILGIETSCDETASAVVEDGKKILSNIVASQMDIHSKYGGVVPELASRRHIQNIIPVIQQSLETAGISLDDVDGIAVTQGPGLIGSLLIGISTAKALSYTKNLPIVGVNHIEGHIYSNFLENDDIKPPFICLVVSGGHTDLVYVGEGKRNYEKLGQTMDDAAGEAFDKVSKLLELGYPGGPIIDRLAKEGNPKAIAFPRPYVWDHDFNFSFSGLKTSVLNYLLKEKSEGRIINVADVSASFQSAVVDVLVEKTLRSAQTKGINTVAVAGGVAANSGLRKRFMERCQEMGYKLYFPRPILCTDNAAMIAGIGYHLLKDNESNNSYNMTLESDAIKEFL
ncbi:TPA: tRNA (adenosine(37)-N6)-threonylcarbamoyltransferase complex transferase subunit TsaD [Candidatus Poribacteria bacterium]|nr:tRNA (adenosine(37)-N6)-threonylcarbamoyltransferase complex transferase subunit TsaD [Candidatus Poribacteria bacterium]